MAPSVSLCCRERELCGFEHDRFVDESDSVQMTCIKSRLKDKFNFERCVDQGVDDGDDKMVTIPNRTVTLVYLSGSCNQIAVQPRRLHERTNWEFERYANVEIPESSS